MKWMRKLWDSVQDRWIHKAIESQRRRFGIVDVGNGYRFQSLYEALSWTQTKDINKCWTFVINVGATVDPDISTSGFDIKRDGTIIIRREP